MKRGINVVLGALQLVLSALFLTDKVFHILFRTKVGLVIFFFQCQLSKYYGALSVKYLKGKEGIRDTTF